MANVHSPNPEIDSFSTIKSTFAFTRRARPPPVEAVDHAERTPLGRGAIKMGKREPKGGLRGIFTRSRTDINSGSTMASTKEEPLPQDIQVVRAQQDTKGPGAKQQALTEQRDDKATETPAEKKPGMRMAMRAATSRSQPTSKIGSKPSLKVTPKPPRRNTAAWDPPPLFQAYPQAIKHAQLASTTLSADSIIRSSIHNRNGSLREDISQSDLNLPIDEVSTAASKKIEKARNKHRRQISGSLSRAEWTQKIYVLVTSGYLLQYSGSGSFDRLPEKMMLLGKDSVAFASDVIPGKHWVLQISQAMDTDGIPAPDARSLLSRLAFRSADYRRTATSFLLVLESAEELESWISAVRREIEALGGKKYVSETGKPKVDETVVRLKSKPSQRYMVQKESERFTSAPNPQGPFPDPKPKNLADKTRNEPFVSIAESDQMGMLAAKRISVATSLASHDSHQLDTVKDASFRLSYMSSGQRTLVTSQTSSPNSSPIREAFPTIEESHQGDLHEAVPPRASAAVMAERRKSMQIIQNTPPDYQGPSKASPARPHSTYGGLGRSVFVPSPSTPNFSIPHAVSKRYMLTRMPENASQPAVTQHKTPGALREIPTRGNKKSSPEPIMVPSLSPVEDQPSPIKLDSPSNHTRPTARSRLKRRPSLDEIPSLERSVSPLETLGTLPGPSPSPRAPQPVRSSSPATPHSSVRLSSPRSGLQSHPVIVADEPSWSARAPALPIMESPPPSPGISSQLDSKPGKGAPPSLASFDPPRTLSDVSRPRRPASMQIIPRSPPISYHKSVPLQDTSNMVLSRANVKPSRSSVLLPPFSEQARSSPASLSSRRLHSSYERDTSRNLLNRRSMPQLVTGPPPAPPPSCALPPIPDDMRDPMLVRGSRNSVRV